MADYKYKLNIDVESKGLKETRAELEKLKSELESAKGRKGGTKDLYKEYFGGAINNFSDAKKSINSVISALDKLEAKGKNLTIADMAKFNNEIHKSGIKVKALDKYMEHMGKTGVSSVGKLTDATYNLGYQVDKVEDKFSQLGNQIQHEIVDNIVRMGFDTMSSAIQKAIYFTKDLDRTLTDIQIVSGKSAEDMAAFAEQANSAARALGSTTDEFANASLIFFQQGGYTAGEVEKLAEATTIASNITRQSTDVVADQLTAMVNAFGTETSKVMTDVVDVFAKVGAVSGSNFEELATATQKFASQARTSGYEGAEGIQEMASQIAVVVETTRQSADSIGIGFKTILSRIQGIKEDSSGEMVTKLSKSVGQLNAELKQLGAEQFEIFDQFGDLRGADELISDLGNTWNKYGDQLSEATKQYVMQEVAGVEQASRLAALFDNWDRYLEILDEAQNAQGTALQQQEVYMDSIDAKSAQLRASFEDMILNLNLDSVIKSVLDGLTNVVDAFGDVLEIGGDLGGLFADINGVSTELGETIGAWVPIIGLALAGFNKFFSTSLATRLAIHQTQQKYIAETAQQMTTMNEVDKKIMATKEQIRKSSGFDKSQEYGNIQQRILDNSVKQLKIEEQRDKVLRKSLETLLSQEKVDSSIVSKVEKYSRQRRELKQIETEILAGHKKIDEILNSVSEDTRNLLTTEGKITQEKKQQLAFEQKETEELIRQIHVQASKKDGDLAKSKDALKSSAEEHRLEDLDVLNSQVAALDRSNVALDQNAKQMERQAKMAQRTQLAIGLLSAATLGGTQIFSGFKDVISDTGDKALGFSKILTGTGTTILTLLPTIIELVGKSSIAWIKFLAPFLPAIAGIAIALGALITVMGGFKSEAEKISEANSEITKSFVEQKEKIDAMKQSLDSVEDSYNRLAESKMSAVEILSSGDQELIDEYLKYAETVAETNPEIVQGYDSQGRAIVDLTTNVKDLNKELMEQQQLNYQMLSSNVTGYVSEISANYRTAASETKRLKDQQASLQEQLKRAMEIGDTTSISKLNAQISQINVSLAEQGKVLADTPNLINANIVQPFFKGNEAVLSFSEKYGETMIETSKGSVELATAINSVVLNVDSLNSAVRAGDLDRVNEILTEAENNFTILDTAIGGSEEKAQALLGTFMEMPTYMQQAALQLQGSFGSQGTAVLDNFDERIRKVLSGSESLDKAFELNFESANKAYGEEIQGKLDSLIKQQEELSAKANTMDSADRAASNYYETMENLEDQIEKTTKELDDYNEAIEDGTANLDRQRELLYDIVEALEETPEGFNEVVDAMESMEEKISDLENVYGPLTEAQSSQLEEMQAQYFDMYIALNDESALFYQNEILKNAEWVTAFKESTGINAAEFSNLQELMNFSSQQGVDVRSWLMSEETAAFSRAKAQEVYDAQMAEAEKVNASYFGVFSVIGHWGALQDAGYTTWQIIKAAGLGIVDAIVNGVVGAINIVAGAVSSMINLVISGVNSVLAAISKIPGVDIKPIGPVDLTIKGKSNLAGSSLANSAQKNKDKTTADDLLLKPTAPPKKPIGGGGSKAPDKIKPNTGGGGKDKDKGKDKKDKDVKDAELDLDPLYEYNTALKLLENEMDILQAKEKDLFGKDLIANLQQQNELLAKKLQILKSESVVIDTQLKNQKEALSSKGFTFDESGMITNYNEMIEKLTKAANSKTGEAKEQAIADLEQIKDVVKDYDKLLTDTSAKLKEDMIKITQELQENYQKQIEVVIDVQLDLSDAYKKLYDFQQKFNEGFDKSNESLENMGDYAENLMGDMKMLEDAISKIANDTNLTEKQKGEMLKKYIDEYMDAAENLDEVIKDMGEKITDSLEEGLELIEKTAEGYEKIKDYASDYADLLKDIYGAAAKDDIVALYDIQIEAQQGLINSLKEQQALAQQYVDALEPGSEEWKKAKEELDNINSEIANSTLDLLDLMRSKMEDFFELSKKALELDIFGGKSLDDVETAFDRINKQQEKYVNTAEKAAKLGKLQAQIQEEIAKTDDPKKKAMLQGFIDKELKALKEKDKLTEKDVERAEKVYLLMLKQQALEAQQMTAMMARLVRDESGNWSYEYVQDVSKVNEAQKDLSDSLEDLMNSDKDNLQSNQEEMLDLYKDYFDDLEKLQEKAMSGEFKSPEEFDKALEELNNKFMEQFGQLEKEQEGLLDNMVQSSMAYLFNMYKQNGGQLGIFSSETEGVIGGLMGALESGNISWTDIIKGNYDLIAEQLGITKEDAQKAIEEMTSSITEDFEESNAFIKGDYEDLKNKVQQATTDMSKAFADYFTGVTENMGNQKDAIDKLNTALGQQKEQIDKVTQSVKDEASAITGTLIPSYNALKDKYEKEVNPKTQEFINKLKDSIKEMQNGNNAIVGKEGLNKALDSLGQKFIESKNKANELIGSATNNTGLKGMEKSAIDAYNKITTLTGNTTKSAISSTNSAVGGLNSSVNSLNTAMGGMSSVASGAVNGVISQLDRIPDSKTTTITLKTRDKVKTVTPTANGYAYTSYNGLKITETGFGPPVPEGSYKTFKSGGYTGNWNGSEGLETDKDRGKLAVLHQKELVLNAEDTKNLLDAVRINRDAFAKFGTPSQNIQTVSSSNQEGDTIIQIDNLELPGVSDANKFLQELKSLPNRAIQYKYSKKPY